MAKTFNTRLSLKIDSLTNWQGQGDKILLEGEVGFVTAAASKGTGLTEPVVMMMVGDGTKTVTEHLANMSFYAKASDVLEACKSENGLISFIKEHSTAVTGFVTTADFNTFKTTLEQWETETRSLITANTNSINAILEDAPDDYKTLKSLKDAIDKEATDRSDAIKTLEEANKQSISDLKNSIGNLSNIMNFRGTVTDTADVTDPKAGDVVCVSGTGKEFVYDGTEWEEIGDVSAQATAISALQDRAKALEDNVADIKENYATKTELKTAKESLETISTAQTTLQQNIDALSKIVGDNETDIENKVSALTTRVSTAEGTISSNSGAIENIKTQISNLKISDLTENDTAEYVIFDCGSATVNI